MATRLDVMQAALQEPAYAHFPIATEPTVLYCAGAEVLQGAITPDFDAVFYMMGPHVDAASLGATALRIVPYEGSRWAGTKGSLYNQPKVINDRIHYPVIDVAVDLRHPQDEMPNSTIRHELRHVIQPSRYPLYANEKALFLTRLSMLGAAAASLAEAGPGSLDVLALAASLGYLSTRTGGYALLHVSTPQEIDARLFAWQQSKYKPLSIA